MILDPKELSSEIAQCITAIAIERSFSEVNLKRVSKTSHIMDF
jgi:hypothetical protein